jgi:hypothetical protein
MTEKKRGMTIVVKSDGDFGFLGLRDIHTACPFGCGMNGSNCASLIG